MLENDETLGQGHGEELIVVTMMSAPGKFQVRRAVHPGFHIQVVCYRRRAGQIERGLPASCRA